MKNKLPGFLVEVHGWVMLKKVPAGKYRLVLTKGEGYMPIYWFFKPKGKKAIIGHYADDVQVWMRPDNKDNLNKIVMLPA